MTSEVVAVTANATLLEAVRKLVNTHATALPVVDVSNRLIGLISEIDIIQHLLSIDDEAASFSLQFDAGKPMPDPVAKALASAVADVMTKNVITVEEDTPLRAVAGVMQKNQFKRIPVVRGSTIVGIVRRVDLLRVMLSRSSNDPTLPQTPPTTTIGDEQLRRDVVAAVRRLGVHLGVGFDVVANAGVIHLWGEVFTEDDQLACQAAAAKVPGVVDVLVHMQVLPRRRATALHR